MANTKLVKVDSSLVDVFGKIGKEFAEKIKKEFNLQELYVPNTLASQVLAGKFSGKTMFEFKVEKTGLNKGRLILVN